MPPAPLLRANVWEWIQTALLAANLVWTALCLGGVLPATLVVTGTLTAALVVVHFLECTIARDASGAGFHAAGWLLVPFLLYATANVLWVTPVSWLGWQDWFLWAQTIAVFWVVLNGIRAPATRMTLFVTLLALGVVGVLLACYQRFVQPDWLMLGAVQAPQFMGRASGMFGIPNSLAAFLLLLIPPCLALAFRRRVPHAARVFFAWLGGVLLVGLLLSISRGGWIAIGLALSAWPLFSRRWRWWRRMAVATGTVLLVALAVGVLYWKAPKVRERLAILVRDTGERSRPIMWQAAWKIFLAHPIWGSGAGSYAVLFEAHRPPHHQNSADWAHNDYLNTLSDYGVVGATLAFGAAGAIVGCAWRARPRLSQEAQSTNAVAAPGALRERLPLIEHPHLATAFGVGVLAFGIHLFVDFHLKIPALGLALATVAGIAVAQRWPARKLATRDESSSRARRIACALVAFAVGLAGIGWNLPRLRAEGIRYPLRRDLDRLAMHGTSSKDKVAAATRALQGLAEAVALDPENADAWADRAYAAAILGREQPERMAELGRIAEHDARQALAESKVVAEFWQRLGVALDMQRRWNEAGPAISEGLKLAPFSATAWFQQAYHFALNPVTEPLARSAVATCLRLDPSRAEADALRRHLTAGR